jgi:hypothetical protein
MEMQSAGNTALNKRLEGVAWGLFLIMLGGLWLVPADQIPSGTWLIGVGLIMLGLNVARYLNQIPMSAFTIVLGVIALALGLSDFLGIGLPLFPILVILLGAKIIFDMLKREPATS